jgi:hypothetical protein
MEQSISMDEIKRLYPDEWVLIGNPIMSESRLQVIEGIPVLHSRDKTEVCYLGRDKTKNYAGITLIYTGTFKHRRVMTGIFNRVK